MAASPTLIFLSLLFALANGIPDPQQDGGSASAGSDSFSLLAVNPLLPPARLQVYRGQWTPLLRRHLPITKRVLRGGRHVCRIEMEELAPIFSVAGHLEPKKFDCSFQDGDVRYYHEGNPLLNVDTVRVTIFFFRNNYSIIQTADIPVDILDHPKSMEISGRQDQRPRIRGSLELDVKNIKAGSQAISPSVVKIDYKPEEEECYLSFTRPDLQPAGRQQNEQSRLELQTGRPVVTPWWESNAGLWAPRLGRPLASGPAVGGGRRWPLFGQIVAAFNRTPVDHFEHECHEALLQGYRYLHRKPNSPGIDYVPLQVTIWKKLPDGDREFVTREARYLRVNIVGARPPEPPVIRIFRQVNLTHIGGSFSVLPKDCIHVVTPDSDDLLEVNVTKVQGPLYAQLVNLRDPTRPVLSFHIAELRKGLVALQLLNYAEMAEKIFTLTLVAINPFMQVSEPVSLRLVSTLQPVFPAMGFANERKPFVFQVFSLPLFSYTGALSIVQKYNLQVVGYIDESVVRFHVLANKEEEEYFKLPNATGTGGGYLRLQGVPLIGVHSTTSWTLIEIANQQLMYAHPGSLQPTVDRFRLRLTLDSQRMFYQQLVNRGLRRRRNAGVSESELELPVRVVRIYENARESALRTNVAISLHHGTAHCFMSEELITPEALQAARSDFVDLKFIVKVQPSQGDLVRRSSLLQTSVNVTQSHQQLSSLSGSDGDKEAPQISVVGLAELERHDICYLSHRRDARIDMFGLKQTGRSGFPVVAVNINIHPRPKYQLTKRVDPSQLLEVRETVNFAAITSNYLRFVVRPTRQWLRSSAHNLMPLMPNASEIVYTITRQPRFLAGPSRDAGRLVSLAAASASQHEGDMALRPGLTSLLRELEPTGVTQFSQDQVNSGDIVYVPPVEDIGPTNQMAEFSYTVSAPGIMVFNKERFRFRVIAEDDQTPLLELLKPLEVHRDGEVAIDSEILRLTDEDTLVEKLVLRLTRAPTHGNIFESVQISVFNATTNATTSKMDRRKLGEGEVISASLINLGKLSYIQDGSNVKEDSFNLTASDGYQESVPLKLKVTIRPRVLSEPVWNLLVNNSILVEENSTVILHPSVFPPLTPPPMGGARFFVVVPPTKGKLVLDKRCKMSQFSTNDVANSRIAYRHGPTEIGTDAKFDLVRVWDFKTGNIFSLNFTLLPINSQPPTITAVTPLQVNEGSSVVLSHHAISVRDPDTIDANIRIKLITHPKWGHLELRPENTSSVGFADFSFTAEDLSDGRVYYINSRHRDGLESVSDIFSLRAYDQEFQSKEAIPIHVSIHPVNDEIPSVRLVDYFSVPLNGRRVLTPYLLAISDRDVPRDILQIAFPQLPRFGHLTVYWQHGEQYTITESSAPISESYLGMMNLVYIQNCSVELPARDTFTVSVSDGQHVVKKSAHILLRQENRYGPEIKVAEEGGLVIEGLAWRQLTTALSVSDVDTLAEDLIITVLRAPSLGRLERLQRQEIAGSPAVEDLLEIALDRFEEEMSGNKRDTKALREGDSFTKRQLDSGRIYYTYTGEYTSSYVYDSITLSASDGRFEAGPIDVPIRIRATKGRKNQVVQSQSSLNAELLEKSKADSDPLLSDAASEPWEPKDKQRQQHQQRTHTSEFVLEGFRVSVAEKVEVVPGERRPLVAGEHIHIEPIGDSKTNENITEVMARAHFQYLDSEMSRRGCILLIRANSTGNQSLSEFTYEDIMQRQIVLGTETCFSKSPRSGIISVLLTIPSQKPISFSILVKIVGEADTTPRPTIAIGQAISVIPYADIPLTLKHIQLLDTGVDPTKVYLYSPSRRFHWKHSCNATATIFSFFNIIHEDIIYHHTDDMSPITLNLVNLNNLDVEFNADQIEHFVESIIPLTESSPLLQYLRADCPDHITSDEIHLQLSIDELYTHVVSSKSPFVRAPSPEELTRVRPGEMGFILTPKHLLMPSGSALYSLDSSMSGGRVIIDMTSGNLITHFTQEDVNRLRLALVVISNPLHTGVTFVGHRPARMETAVEVKLSVTTPESGAIRNATLAVYWAQVGFDKKRYRICAAPGTLTLPLVRRGAIGHRVDVHVGLEGAADLDRLEAELLSPKLVVFEAGEALKYVRIRVAVATERTAMVRQLFFVSVKAPTAAVLDTNNEAQIIVSGRRNCRNPPYFVPFNGSRTASADGRKDGSRMSLHDWLASNVIPDSNALNKAYLRSMKRRKRGPQFTCDSGWTLYNSRCYRYYPGQNRTWLEARGHCEGEHGYLASVADAGVDGWLKAVLNPRPPVWIGLHKPVLNGAWAWHSMEQTNYTNWDVGFPRRLRAGREVHNRRGRMGRHRRRLFRRHSHASLQQPLPRPHFHTTWQSSSTYSGRLRRSISDQPQQKHPRVCVMLSERGLAWQNAACVGETRMPFVCMKNPN